jgi:hypothetical protein
MPDIYDDPDLAEQLEDSDFPPTLKFAVIGDRARGTVIDISKFEGKSQKPSLKYVLGEVTAKQAGRQTKLPRAEIIAGSKNLKGQLMAMRPRPGDVLDIEYIESRPSSQPSPTKIFKISVDRAEPAESNGHALVSAPSDGDEEEEDLFGD